LESLVLIFPMYTNAIDLVLMILEECKQNRNLQKKWIDGLTAFIKKWEVHRPKDRECLIPIQLFLGQILDSNHKLLLQINQLVNRPRPRLSSRRLTKSLSKGTSELFNKPTIELLDIHPRDLAIHICASEWALFSVITPEDLLFEKKSTTIAAYNENSNKYNFFFQSEILLLPNMKQRTMCIQRLIETAIYLKKWRNYGALSIIIGALNSAAVQRLKDCWKELPPKLSKKFLSMEDFLSPAKNFKLYRKKNKSASLPTIPLLSVILRDILHINETPTYIDNLLNYQKFVGISKTLSLFTIYLTVPYQFERLDSLDFAVDGSGYLTEEALWKLSKSINVRKED